MTARDVLHYRITGELGQGAMGEVFRAVDQRLGREVALKMLPADVAGDPGWETRMLREAQAASALNHPGIVTLHDIETEGNRTFLVMELVVGTTFRELAQGQLPWRRALELVLGVADALAAAHDKGILHRDVKSDNLMLTTSGQTKVLDFGLAKLHSSSTAPGVPVAPSESMALAATVHPRGALSSDVTQDGQLVGTPAYMAPECFAGVFDQRSEVFSLGVVLYELLAGRRPFDRDSALATMAAIQLEEPQPPSKVDADRGIPERVDAIVAHAIAKDPEQRTPTMHALIAEIKEALAPPRERWPIVLAATSTLLLAGGVVAWFALRGGGEAALPIEISGSRRLTLDRGCEEYPRFHPDGRRIIYDGLIDGDYEILSLDVTSNERKRITKTPGWDYASAISPDGKLVAYVHEDITGRLLRVVDLEGGPPRDLGTIVGYPSWTHDGKLLVGDAAGRVLRRELAGGETLVGQLPAGARVYHVIEVQGGGVAALWWTSSETNASALSEIDPDGRVRTIEEALTDYEGGLAVSHLHRGYYATRRAAIDKNQVLFRPWGGGTPIAVPGNLTPGAGLDAARDGKQLVFSTCIERQAIHRIRTGSYPELISSGEWQDTSPVSIDATHLLISSDRLGQQQGWLLDLAGSEAPRPVTPAAALGASPSPDGKLVVYASAGGRGGLEVVGIDGQGLHHLTTDPSDTAPVFTRDGRQIVFERTIAGTSHIMVIGVDGGTPRDIGTGTQPATSRVDDTLVYVGLSSGTGARYVMRTDLTGAVSTAIPNLEPAAWQRPRISADGTRLLVIHGYQQLVTIGLDGSGREVVYATTTGSINTADFAANGDGIIAAIGAFDGDLWLADGTFP